MAGHRPLHGKMKLDLTQIVGILFALKCGYFLLENEQKLEFVSVYHKICFKIMAEKDQQKNGFCLNFHFFDVMGWKSTFSKIFFHFIFDSDMRSWCLQLILEIHAIE